MPPGLVAAKSYSTHTRSPSQMTATMLRRVGERREEPVHHLPDRRPPRDVHPVCVEPVGRRPRRDTRAARRGRCGWPRRTSTPPPRAASPNRSTSSRPPSQEFQHPFDDLIGRDEGARDRHRARRARPRRSPYRLSPRPKLTAVDTSDDAIGSADRSTSISTSQWVRRVSGTHRVARVSQFLLIKFRRRPRLRGRPGFLAGWPAQGMGCEIWRR